jgi:hypothetical protein
MPEESIVDSERQTMASDLVRMRGLNIDVFLGDRPAEATGAAATIGSRRPPWES